MQLQKHKLWTNSSGLSFAIFITLCLSKTFAFLPVEQDNITHFVSGAHVLNLTDPLFYDTFVPIIYEVVLPQWKISDLKIEWPANLTSSCESSDTWGDNWTHMACPVLHHMNNVTEHFLQSLFDWKSFNSSHKTKSILLSSCQEITRHFKSYSVGHEEWDEYFFEDLKNCPLGMHTVYEKLFVPWKDVNTEFYSTMLSRFLDETISTYKYRITGFSRYAVATNAFTALQGLQLLDYVYTTSKWSNAISTCDSQRIPYTLISKETLSLSLREIERATSSNDGYQLTLAATDFSNYYKLPLANCAFSTKNTMLVRILVPVKKKMSQYKLSLVQPIPFLRTHGNVSEICEHGNASAKILFEVNTGALIPSDCKQDELCLIPDLASRPVTDYCLSALVQNSTENIISYCHIHCKHFDSSQLPYFRRLSSDKYVVLGKSKLDVFISCDTQPYKVLSPPATMGAMEITLPCSCQLVHQRESLYSMTPCGKELVLREIMPVNWSAKQKEIGSQMFIYRDVNDKMHNFIDEETKNLHTGFTSSQNLHFVILSSLVVFLLCSNAFLICIVAKMYKRVCKLEQGNSQRVGCNFYETPMFVRANDD